jgi:hypothetical protein
VGKKQKNGGENRSTIAEMERRVGIVLEMILSGLKRRDILRQTSNSSKLAWDVSSRQIDTYIAKATEEIEAQFEEDKDRLIKQTVGKYDYLYKALVAQKKFKDAVVPLDKISELAGIKVIKTESEVTYRETDVLKPKDDSDSQSKKD